MALTNAEKQKRYRERQRQLKAEALRQPEKPDLNSIFRTPFFESFQANANAGHFDLLFDVMGFEGPRFDDDADPKSYTGMIDPEDDKETYLDVKGSMGRAEMMVSGLLDAAVTLASIVKSHKEDEIGLRIKELKSQIESDPSRALELAKRIIELEGYLAKLNRAIRWPVPNWKTTST